MAETRPTGEQLRFVSAATGEHILDAYLEAAEKGGRQLPDMLADIYDPTTGLFRADLFEFRVTADRKLQFRVGDFADTTTGWRDVDSHPYLFRPRGAWAQSTAYSITDIATYSSQTYICMAAHTSTTTFDYTKWVSIGSGASVSNLTDLLDVTITSPAAGNILRFNGTEFVNYPDSNYAAASHTHAISAITNLQTTLDGKAASSHTHVISDVTNLQATLDGKAATGHTHVISDVTNLQATLDGKASTSHGHAISDITNLQTTLDAKLDDSQATAFGLSLLDDANAAAARITLGLGTASLEGAGYFATAVHSHAISDVTGLQTALDGKQPLDGDLTAIAALAGTSGFLKKTAANTWTLDTATYLTSLGIGSQTQAWDADLDAIAGLSGTSGILKKTAANTWELDTSTYLTSLGIGSLTQAYDATLQSLSALGTTADRLAYTTAADTWAETTITAQARTFLAAATQTAQLSALGFSSSGGNFYNNLIFLATGTVYTVPSSVKAIVVWMTGAGGAGGSASYTYSVAATRGGAGGSGGGTILFTLPVTAGEQYTVTVGAMTGATAGSSAKGADGSATIFKTSGNVTVATAPGGVGGVSNYTNTSYAATGNLGPGGVTLPSSPVSPNATYVPTGFWTSVNGGQGSPPVLYNLTGAIQATGGNGGSTFWGSGGIGQNANNTSGNLARNGLLGGGWGCGGAGGSINVRATGTITATGAPGQAGVCVIMEVRT